MRHGDVLERLSQEIHGPRELYLKWEQVVRRYKRGEKTKLAQIRASINKQGKTQADIQSETYAHPDFIEYLAEWDHADREYTRAKVAYDNLETDLEAYRSALAFDRDTARAFGG